MFGQRQPIDEFHYDVEVAVVLAGVEHGHGVTVAEPSRCLTLAEEPLASRRIGGGRDAGVQELDGHLAAEARVESGVDPRGSADAELIAEYVAFGQSA